MPAFSMTSAVPDVHTSLNPMSTNLRGDQRRCRLSLSVTLRNGSCVATSVQRPVAPWRTLPKLSPRHYFAGRFHLRPQHVSTPEICSMKHGDFHVVALPRVEVRPPLNILWKKSRNFARLSRARNFAIGTPGPWKHTQVVRSGIHLEHINLAPSAPFPEPPPFSPRNGKLDIIKPTTSALAPA